MNFSKTENLVADIRNKLTPFWNLVAIIRSGNYPAFDIKKEADAAFNNQTFILADLNQIEAMDEKKLAIATEWVEKNYPKSHFKEQLAEIFLAGMNHEEPYRREYDRPVPKYGDLMTIEEWNDAVNDGYIMDDDGSGYWVKDGMTCDDSVFGTDQEDATHVIWYNK